MELELELGTMVAVTASFAPAPAPAPSTITMPMKKRSGGTVCFAELSFPSFLPKQVENIKDTFARKLATRIDRLPVPVRKLSHSSLKSLSVFLGLFAWPNTSHYNLITFFFFFLECTPPHIFYLQIEKRTKCVGVGAGAGNDGGRHS